MKSSWLILQDGTRLEGESFGAPLATSGEVVFSTGMVGYGETMTDPSYEGQILCFTYPMIGNYGVPSKTSQSLVQSPFESLKIHIKGLILSEYSEDFSHWSARMSLHQWMLEQNVPGICGIDTRKLTILLRNRGSMLGAIMQENTNLTPHFYDPNEDNLAAKVTSPSIQIFLPEDKPAATVLLVDCGSKSNILRSLLKRGAKVVSVPFDHDFLQPRFKEEVSDYHGIVVSNGPGDPRRFDTVVSRLRQAIEDGSPMMGICLGHQLMARAVGAQTYKLKYGHRSHNQPCLMEGSNRCFITSQNHGFAVDTQSLEKDWKPYFTNVNDGTNEGIRHTSKPVFSVQFHPEAAPGPQDTSFLFDNFLESL